MSGVASIALLTPIVASNAVFSVRRASRGVDALSENPLYAATNFDIAAAQVLKGSRAATSIVSAADPSLEAVTKSATQTIKEVSKANKFLKGTAKVIDFTADHINPIICAGSVINVLGSDDKVNEAAAEVIKLPMMFGFEAMASRFVGMPLTKKINGKVFTFKRDGLYKKILSKEQISKIDKFCSTNKYMNYAPSIAKGLFFVGASILGYQLGDKVADIILDRKPSDSKTKDVV